MIIIWIWEPSGKINYLLNKWSTAGLRILRDHKDETNFVIDKINFLIQ